MARLLLVDDDEDSRTALAMWMELDGWSVFQARALADLDRFRSGFDAAIVDLRLPDGSGWDVPKRVRATTLVLLSGVSTAVLRRDHRASSFHHLVQKPADPELLARLVAGQ